MDHNGRSAVTFLSLTSHFWKTGGRAPVWRVASYFGGYRHSENQGRKAERERKEWSLGVLFTCKLCQQCSKGNFFFRLLEYALSLGVTATSFKEPEQTTVVISSLILLTSAVQATKL